VIEPAGKLSPPFTTRDWRSMSRAGTAPIRLMSPIPSETTVKSSKSGTMEWVKTL
jgi:hypothetical protein